MKLLPLILLTTFGCAQPLSPIKVVDPLPALKQPLTQAQLDLTVKNYVGVAVDIENALAAAASVAKQSIGWQTDLSHERNLRIAAEKKYDGQWFAGKYWHIFHWLEILGGVTILTGIGFSLFMNPATLSIAGNFILTIVTSGVHLILVGVRKLWAWHVNHVAKTLATTLSAPATPAITTVTTPAIAANIPNAKS